MSFRTHEYSVNDLSFQTKRAEVLADGGSLLSGHLADDTDDYSNDYEEAKPCRSTPAAYAPKAVPAVAVASTSEHNTRRRTRSNHADSSDGDYTPKKSRR